MGNNAMRITLDRTELSHGKYTRQFANLTDDQMMGLLWLVGEFSVRSSGSEFSIDDKFGGQRRKFAALKAIAEFSRHPMGHDETLAYIRETHREGDRAALKWKLEKLAEEAHKGITSNSEVALKSIEKQLNVVINDLKDGDDE